MPLNATPFGSAQPQGQAALDLILVEGFTGSTVIGIYDEELHDPQPLVIDLQAGVPRARACDTDRIGDTIHYGVVCERLRRLMAEHRVQLLEAFAEAIAEILLGEFGATWVRVKVVKPRSSTTCRRSACRSSDGPASAKAHRAMGRTGVRPCCS